MHSKPNLSCGIIIALLLGIYVLYLLHYFNVLHFKTTVPPTPVTLGGNLKGPYEACEDQICPNYSNKKSCLCESSDRVKNCCVASCGGNQYCIEACEPMFDPCQ